MNINWTRVILLLSLTVIGQSAFAQNATGSWAKEPSSFLGFKLGAPIAPELVPPCPVSSIGSIYSNSDQKPPPPALGCGRKEVGSYSVPTNNFDPATDGTKTIYMSNAPLGFLLPNLVVSEGVLQSINTTNRHSTINYKEVKAALITRFGNPTQTVPRKVKTVGGAEFNSELLIWSGKNVLMSLDSLSDRYFDSSSNQIIEEWRFAISTEKYLSGLKRQGESKAKKESAKF